MKEGDSKQSGSADVTEKIDGPAAMMENGGKADVAVTLRDLLASKSRHGMLNSPPVSPPFVWDTEANQQASGALSPISTQDLTPGPSQDMPVSSTAFQWTGEHSLVTSAGSRSHVESSSGGGAHPLTDWTHFGDSITSLHPSDGSARDTHNILQELLKDAPDNEASDSGSNALLRQILSEKPNVDDSKEIRLLLGDPNMALSNGSPNSMQHDPMYNTFLQNLNDLTTGLNPPHKRKIEELEGADAGNPAKLSDKNKLLAGLLQSAPIRHNEIPAAGLPTPNPGDLPQNKLPKDLPSRIIPALGQQRALPNGVHRNGAGGLGDLFSMENSTFASRNGLSVEQMDLFDLIDELQDSGLGAPDSLQSNPLTPVDKQAIDSIRQNLLQDFPNGSSAAQLSDVMSYRDPPLASPGSMIPKYNVSQAGSIPRPQMHGFSNNGDMLMQRLPGSGGHMMLPNHVSPPSRPGPIPPDFSASRSPAPSSAIPSSHVVRQQIRMASWNRQARAAQQSNAVNMAQQGTMQMSNVTPNVTIGRSFSIPNAGPHGGYPVNGYQNVPQQNTQRFSGQQTVPYSPPPTNMQFQVPGPGQPLSPRHLNSQAGRMTRPSNNGMWIQQQPMAGMGAGANQMSVASQMNVGGPQQNPPPPYGNQQFMNQPGSQQNFSHPSQMIQQQNVGQQSMQRFPGQGAAQAAFNQQQAMLQQQQDTFGNGNSFYNRGMAGGAQPRMPISGQNSQIMRSSLADDLRSNEGTFGQYQLNGASSAPPSANPQQQSQFRWDLPGDRQNMAVPTNSGINGASRIPASALDQGFQHFDSFFDTPANGSLNGQLHMNEQQQFRVYSNDNPHLMGGHMQQQQTQQQTQQNPNQSFAPLSTSASCGELLSMSHPGNSPQHMQPGDRSKSLLQQLLSDNGP